MMLWLTLRYIYSLYNTTPGALNYFVAVLACDAHCILQTHSPQYIVFRNLRRVTQLGWVITLNWRREEENLALLFLDYCHIGSMYCICYNRRDFPCDH